MGKKKVTGISSMEDYNRPLLDFGARIAGSAIGSKAASALGGKDSLIAAGQGAEAASKLLKKATSRVRGH